MHKRWNPPPLLSPGTAADIDNFYNQWAQGVGDTQRRIYTHGTTDPKTSTPRDAYPDKKRDGQGHQATAFDYDYRYPTQVPPSGNTNPFHPEYPGAKIEEDETASWCEVREALAAPPLLEKGLITETDYRNSGARVKAEKTSVHPDPFNPKALHKIIGKCTDTTENLQIRG